LTGGCLCGAVRYRVTAEPVETLFCHCQTCRRAHGAPVVAWLTVPIAGFEITAGEPAAYRSSPQAFRHFCGRCGTPLTWREAEDPKYVDVSIASLDDPELAPPGLHLWTESKISWLDTADNLPRYETNQRPKRHS